MYVNVAELTYPAVAALVAEVNVKVAAIGSAVTELTFAIAVEIENEF